MWIGETQFRCGLFSFRIPLSAEWSEASIACGSSHITCSRETDLPPEWPDRRGNTRAGPAWPCNNCAECHDGVYAFEIISAIHDLDSEQNPSWMISRLDFEADRLGVPRQSLIKVWIAERLAATKT